MRKPVVAAVVAGAVLAVPTVAKAARDYISIVGSSTVYAFATVVTEQFGKNHPLQDAEHRVHRIRWRSQSLLRRRRCRAPRYHQRLAPDQEVRGRALRQQLVTEILEVKVGYDGIVVANSKKAPRLEMSRKDLFRALARLDVEMALNVAKGDAELDSEFQSALRRLATYIREDSRNVGHAIDVTFIVRSLERIGDHAKNISEHAIFPVKGKDVRHVSPDSLDQEALERA